MELEQIRVFLAVADRGSYTKAARELFISHSTTSRAVSALEGELGTKLVDRQGGRVLGLTPAGEILRDRGRALLKQSEDIRSAVSAAK